MDKLNLIFFLVAIFTLFCAALLIVIDRRRTKGILTQLDAMLTAAINGNFNESAFDESMLSAVETKLAHYLSASAVSAKNLEEEKEKIKKLIADISHQTKTPIANILLYAQLLREQNLPKTSQSCVMALNSQAEKLNFLIGALMKTSRLEAGIFQLHPKQVAVSFLLEAALAQIAPKAEEKRISIVCLRTGVTACCDPKWTTEAIYNIVDNAVKYTPLEGAIQIKTQAYDLFCRIDISDTGPGIVEEEQAKIFGRFYRVAMASETEGVGIGLYLSRQIISGQGGYIKVTSTLGFGATFSVFLPLEN